jgi:hypothetical protein
MVLVLILLVLQIPTLEVWNWYYCTIAATPTSNGSRLVALVYYRTGSTSTILVCAAGSWSAGATATWDSGSTGTTSYR